MTGDLPLVYRVASSHAETHDSFSLRLEPVGDALPAFEPGQFTMLYKLGVGEIAISVSGNPTTRDGSLIQTIRDVGAVSRALTGSRPGDLIGVRGPYGHGWGPEQAVGHDLVIAAGGVGLAPLRPVLLGALARRADSGRIVFIAGARTPQEFLFQGQLAAWADEPGLEVRLTVDRPATGWHGQVGFVTEPLTTLGIDPAWTIAFICGPEPMMRFSANVLLSRLPVSSRASAQMLSPSSTSTTSPETSIRASVIFRCRVCIERGAVWVAVPALVLRC